MTLAFGRAYGGSTVVYTGTSLIIPPATVERWAVPGIAWDDLAKRSREVPRREQRPPPGGRGPQREQPLFRDGCETLGYRVEQFPVNLKGCKGVEPVQPRLPQRRQAGHAPGPAPRRRGGRRRGDHQLPGRPPRRPRALRDRAPTPGTASPPRWEPGDYRIKARAVVLAASAVNSPALLLRSGFGARAAGARTLLHRASGAHPGGRARPPDHELRTATRRASTAITSPPRTASSSRPACTSRSPRRRTSSASAPSTPS